MMARSVGYNSIYKLDVSAVEQVVVHQSTARHVAGLELLGVGAGFPQVSSGPV